MRIQLCIPDQLAAQLQALAFEANRSPRQQAEWLLWRAIAQAAQEEVPSQPQEVASVAQ